MMRCVCWAWLLLAVVFIIVVPNSIVSALSASSSRSTMSDAERPSQYYPSFFESLPSLKGKTVVITGCSRGLGYVTALTVAKKGGSVIMLNRLSSGDNAEIAFQKLLRQQQESDDDKQGTAANDNNSEKPVKPVHHYLVDCDLLSFDSVRKACQRVQELTKLETTGGGGGVNVLCNNAGIMLQPDIASQDGYDITASTNMLSHFLITRELLPCLERGAITTGEPSRVITMSSASGYGGPPLDVRYFEQCGGNLGGDNQSNSYNRYHQTKLANLAFTAALHDRLQQRSGGGNKLSQQQMIQALACTPGVCGTDMFVHATTIMNGQPAPKSMVPSTEDGCMAQLKCIFDPNVKSGELWGPAAGRGDGTLECTPIRPPRILVNDTSKAELWGVCEKAVGAFTIS